MPTQSDHHPESSEAGAEALEQAVERFEEAWEQGTDPNLEDFLPAGQMDLSILASLAHVDLERRLKAGQAVRVETYLERFPILRDNLAEAIELIVREYTLRQRREPEVSRLEYLARFPQYQEMLEKRLPTDATLDGGSSIPMAKPAGTLLVTPAGDRAKADPPHQAADGDGKVDLRSFLAPPQTENELGRLAQYRVLKELGRGGMGMVLLAEDSLLRRMAALKIMLPKFARDAHARERFLREARAAARVQHDNVVTIFQVGEERGIPFIAMEFLKGEPLDRYLKEKGEFSVAQTVRIGREMAEGLEAAHAEGLIHRDIKPANIWLEAPKGRVKILDFGLAREEREETHLTQSGAVIGTPAFMSPEQAEGEVVDQRSDLFSLGIVLYRLAAGQQPFQGKSMTAILTAITTKDPTPARQLNPEVPEALANLIHRLLAKDPARRFQSANEVVTALRQMEPSVGPMIVKVEPMPTAVEPDGIWAGIDDSATTQATMEPETAAAPAPERRKSSRLPWVLAGLVVVIGLALTAVVMIPTPKGTLVIESDDDPDVEVVVKKDGATIRDKTKDREIELKVGDYGIELAEKKNGLKLNTDKFEITKNGKAVVKVHLEKVPVAKAKNAPLTADPDRKAAEYVLSVGGAVAVNGDKREIMTVGGLPREAFRLTQANLLENKQVTDAELVNFKDCKNLTSLVLHGTKVSNSGMVNFKDCKGLLELVLVGTKVSDMGLANFKDCKNLMKLDLFNTPLSDAGLVYFKDCKNLKRLSLGDTQVSDVGVANFKDSKNLTHLNLIAPNVSDAGLFYFKDCPELKSLSLGPMVGDVGLANFKDCRKLEALYLGNTCVSDAGLGYFKECKNLEWLDLHRTKVTDAGLMGLIGMMKLESLDLKQTKVTAAGIADLAKSLPQCKIEWDKGTVGPKATTDPDRKAAEYVLSVGGTVQVNGDWQEIKAAVSLPREVFQLTGIALHHDLVSDAGLGNFKDCKNLTSINLAGTKISDTGLANFTNCKNLTYLALTGTKVSDAGLAYFKDCKNLTAIIADKTQVTDLGLANFKDCKKLTSLALGATKVSEVGLANFNGCKNLMTLYLGDTRVSDAGLTNFKDCKNLTLLELSITEVTDSGLANFKGCKNLGFLGLSSTKVTDAGLANFKDCKNLTELRLIDTRVGDAGLANFKDCKGLIGLGLNGTNVSDAGLAPFKDCKGLIGLWLAGTKVSDAGLAPFKDCKNLVGLNLGDTHVSDVGLAHFKECKSLTNLWLNGTKVSDAGIALFRDCADLAALQLDDTQISDAGLKPLAVMTKLELLNLKRTKVTAAGIADVAKALPQCKIEWDKGTVEPKQIADPDRKAAEYVLSVGGGVEVNRISIKTTAELPREAFRLTGFDLKDNKQVSDAGMAHFKDCKNLIQFNLSATELTDAGLACFRDCKTLMSLNLAKTQLSDAGLGNFKDCKSLTNLNLAETQLSDAGLANFKDCTNLTRLTLYGTKVSDEGLVYFKDCTNLTWLHLSATRVCDRGMAYFKACKNLTDLHLDRTLVSDAGLTNFKDCKNLTDLTISQTQVSDMGLANFKGCKNLTTLALYDTKVSDAGLVYFKDCKNLTSLRLDDTKVSDAGLANLKDCRSLMQLTLSRTKVTAAGVADLKKALPNCKIEWDSQ